MQNDVAVEDTVAVVVADVDNVVDVDAVVKDDVDHDDAVVEENSNEENDGKRKRRYIKSKVCSNTVLSRLYYDLNIHV